ncbi:MAG: hypothetical protein FJ315_07805, partial [SAR202 cluster bacterium]|nr:hypothetical protein [SAR202 cluster bacterium]
MRWVLGTVLGLVLVCSSVRADLNPQQLASFRLDRFPALQGFQASRPGSWRVALLHDRPSQATATLNCRYFHGPT